MTVSKQFAGQWSLILGSSSGMGAGVSRALAQAGSSIAGVHFDRRQAMPAIEALVRDMEHDGATVKYFNANAAAPETRAEVCAFLKTATGGKPIRVLLHSLAFGTLKPFIAADPANAIAPKDMDMTLDVMAHSLVYWTQDLVRAGLIGKGSRIFGMTSEGDVKAWRSYGAVSAAKCAMESHLRQLAVELAPLGVTANAIRAGVTDTPALRKIPESAKMADAAKARNPFGRLTTPADIGSAVVSLASDGCHWLTGNVIGVDGAELITA